MFCVCWDSGHDSLVSGLTTFSQILPKLLSLCVAARQRRGQWRSLADIRCEGVRSAWPCAKLTSIHQFKPWLDEAAINVIAWEGRNNDISLKAPTQAQRCSSPLRMHDWRGYQALYQSVTSPFLWYKLLCLLYGANAIGPNLEGRAARLWSRSLRGFPFKCDCLTYLYSSVSKLGKCAHHTKRTWHRGKRKHVYNICTVFDQRLIRCADVVQMLYKCFVFAGITRIWIEMTAARIFLSLL